MPAERFPIHSAKAERRKKMQHRQHVFIALVLIADGISSLTDAHAHHGVAVPILIIAAGLLLLGTFGYEQWHHHKHGGHDRKIGAWVEIAGALLAFAETVHRVHAGRHHTLFYVLNLIAPLLVAGLAWAEIAGKTEPYMEVDDEGFTLRIRMLRPRKRIEWRKTKAFRVTEKFLEFVQHDGSVVKVKIAQVTNRAEALAWATARFEQRGLAPQ